jgi:hypothetical protein
MSCAKFNRKYFNFVLRGTLDKTRHLGKILRHCHAHASGVLDKSDFTPKLCGVRHGYAIGAKSKYKIAESEAAGNKGKICFKIQPGSSAPRKRGRLIP